MLQGVMVVVFWFSCRYTPNLLNICNVGNEMSP